MEKIKAYFKDFKFSEHAVGIAFFALLILSTIMGGWTFLRFRNVTNILRQVSYTGVIALGMALIIISGGIDLSVGSMCCFVGGITVYFINAINGSMPSFFVIVLAILVALVCGTACGFINGFLTTKFGLAPFIVTLGTMNIFRSLIQYITKGANVLSVNQDWAKIGTGYFLSIPTPVWLFLIMAVILHFYLNETSIGRYTCAVGSNEQVAKYSAINAKLVKLIPYMITGFTVGITAIMWTSRLNCINPADCTGYEMDAIAAVVIGGTLMSGGKGSIWGTVLGAIMLGMINNMLTLSGVSAYLQAAVKGLVIIVAVLLQRSGNDK